MVRKIKHHSKKILIGVVSRLKGFSLIELLVVIALLAILATAVLVAINPAKRLAQTRDAVRKSDISAIANAANSAKFESPSFYYPGCKDIGQAYWGCYPQDTDPPLAPGYVKSVPIGPLSSASASWPSAGYYAYRYYPNGTCDPLRSGIGNYCATSGFWINTCLENPDEPIGGNVYDVSSTPGTCPSNRRYEVAF